MLLQILWSADTLLLDESPYWAQDVILIVLFGFEEGEASVFFVVFLPVYDGREGFSLEGSRLCTI